MMLDLLMAVVETSYTSLPLTGRAGSGCNQDCWDIIPGWTKEVEPLRLESNFFYRKWLAAGTPRQGEHNEAKLRSHPNTAMPYAKLSNLQSYTRHRASLDLQ